ncbi:MAG: metallopeptidase TldD-related protein, partial [Pseudomonadota bacterium]
MNEKEKRRLLNSILDYSKDLEFTELVLYHWDTSLTRVAGSQVHQHVAEVQSQLFITIADGKRICSVSTNNLEFQSIKRTIGKARDLVKETSPLPHFTPPSGPYKTGPKSVFSRHTADCSPNMKVGVIRRVIKIAQDHGLATHAKFLTGEGEIWIANSLGTLAFTDFTDASLSLILTGENRISGYGASANPDVFQIDWESLTHETIKKCKMQRRTPVDIFTESKRGEAKYLDALLEPGAVADWVKYLGWIGFNSLHYQEQESFMCDHLGERIMGENITIWDDGGDLRGYVMPFDFEGTPKKKTVFIEKGVARSLA